jgi:hypothetical protein
MRCRSRSGSPTATRRPGWAGCSGQPTRFADADVERLARAEHERWARDLERRGWRHSPADKDPVRKTHPHLVPWEALAEDVREIDRAVVREIPGLLAEWGYAVVPRVSIPRGGV